MALAAAAYFSIAFRVSGAIGRETVAEVVRLRFSHPSNALRRIWRHTTFIPLKSRGAR
jgi:hypothetical protein